MRPTVDALISSPLVTEDKKRQEKMSTLDESFCTERTRTQLNRPCVSYSSQTDYEQVGNLMGVLVLYRPMYTPDYGYRHGAQCLI